MSATIRNSPNLINEFLIALAEACNYFPVKCSRQTLERWMRRGSRGVILESVTIGSRRYTSREAINEDTCLEDERELLATFRDIYSEVAERINRELMCKRTKPEP